jgi:predicted ABC-type ATPase
LKILDKPCFWIVAGPNGSGKSTLYNRADIEGFGTSVWIINPDTLTESICSQEGFSVFDANSEALDRIWTWLKASIRAHHTVGVETVLSTAKYRRLVRTAKSYGFEIRLLYVMLDTVELNIERVRLRVAKGGHGVPEEKIRQRRERSFQQLPWFLAQSDMALLYDNSGITPKLIGRKQGGIIVIDPDAPGIIKDAVS